MKVFGSYARYYDLLYRDKDYHREASHVCRLIRELAPDAKTVLDLGCGTGRHAHHLAAEGYDVLGVDLSEEMLAIANATPGSSRFQQGDIRDVRIGRRFDVVVSLFHVFSYQTTNADLAAAFETVREHLEDGGLVIFDCWYGPAVLHDPPAVRVKRLGDDEIDVVRIAEPVLHPNDNTVDVNYHVIARSKAENATSELHETHVMRYLFKPEVVQFMTAAKLSLVACEEWMTRKVPGVDTWNVVFIGRK